MREKITSIIFVVILATFFALVMVFPKDNQASVQENRPLADMPELTWQNVLNGDFTSDYETYLTDNVGFRSKFVRIGTVIENARGIQRKTEGRIVDLANGARLALNDGKIMEVYRKDPASIALYIDVMNRFSAEFSENCNMYLMMAPTQIEFDKSEYKALSDSQKDTIDLIYSSVNNFKTVNVYDKLKEHADEYIYFRTDHHWTQRGAYYGYQSLMEEKGEPCVALEDMKNGRESGFLGYLYNQANVPEYSMYADDIEYFENGENYVVNAKEQLENGDLLRYTSNIYCLPEEGAAPAYSIFMGGDHAFAEINTNNENGKVALVIKDSYANAVIPLLTNNYEKILIVDPRSFYGTVTELTEKYEIDDIIFINYVVSTSLPEFIGMISDIL